MCNSDNSLTAWVAIAMLSLLAVLVESRQFLANETEQQSELTVLKETAEKERVMREVQVRLPTTTFCLIFY